MRCLPTSTCQLYYLTEDSFFYAKKGGINGGKNWSTEMYVSHENEVFGRLKEKDLLYCFDLLLLFVPWLLSNFDPLLGFSS